MYKVLIVDDELIMRQGLKYMIDWEKEGFLIVGEATNGKEALELVETAHPDIVFTDIVMPLIDGVDLTRLIHDKYPNIQLIVLSGYDRFEYVRQTLLNGVIDYCLKPTLNRVELMKTLERAVDRLRALPAAPDNAGIDAGFASSYPNPLRSRTLEQLIISGQNTRDLFEDDTAAYPDDAVYSLCAIKLSPRNRETLDFRPETFATEKLRKISGSFKDISMRGCLLPDDIYCLMLKLKTSAVRRLGIFADSLLTELKTGAKAFIVVSDSFEQQSSAKEVFTSQIRSSLELAFYLGNEGRIVLPAAQNSSVQAVRTPRSVSEHERFDFFGYNRLLETGSYIEALKMLRQYTDRSLRIQLGEFGIKNQVRNLLYMLIDYMYRDETQKETFRYNAFNRISEAEDSEAFKQAVDTIFGDIENDLADNENRQPEKISKILDYIMKNYTEDLTLEKLADRFNYNYNYLSAFFKQHMNEGFNDYLCRIRIDRACELLKDVRLPVSEVGVQVGYPEHSYFSRVFKKQTGFTPSAYRDHIIG